MPTDDRRWTDAELAAGTAAIARLGIGSDEDEAAAVLDAAAPLIAARTRADEREVLARMLVDHAAREPDGSVDQVVMLHAAELVRDATTERETDA